MEDQLVGTYLRPGVIERATAIGITSVGIGIGIFIGAWGVSLLWHYTPPEITARIANPELRVVQNGPLTVTQERPFMMAPPEPLKIDVGDLAGRVEQLRREVKTAGGNVISREVTVFSNVSHSPGFVVAGWSYRDGSGREPVRQYCYYEAPESNGSRMRIDIASGGVRESNIGTGLVPDLEGALAKCQWWQETKL
jgi:hypothetical protein